MVIQKWEGYWSKKKGLVCACIPLVFVIIGIPLLIGTRYHAINKMRRGLIQDVGELFKDWKQMGLGVIFLPGEKPMANNNIAGDMFDVPNTLRVVLPADPSLFQQVMGSQPSAQGVDMTRLAMSSSMRLGTMAYIPKSWPR